MRPRLLTLSMGIALFLAFPHCQAAGKWPKTIITTDRVVIRIYKPEILDYTDRQQRDIAYPPRDTVRPPVIYYRTRPTELVLIDGVPRLKRNGQWGVDVVENSSFVIVKDSDEKFYLYGGRRWYVAPAATGPYTYAQDSVSRQLRKIERGFMKAARKDGVDFPPCDAAPVYDILVSTVPAILIQSSGDPQPARIPGTSLVYVQNSPNDVFFDTATYIYYVQAGGSWYRSDALKDSGDWQPVQPQALPADFKKIPAQSAKASTTNRKKHIRNLKSTIPDTAIDNSFTAMKIGLFAIGLDTYWPQFQGLEDRLQGYLQKVAERLAAPAAGNISTAPAIELDAAPAAGNVHAAPAIELVNAGLVDTTDKAFAAGRLFRSEDVELIFLYVSTYALSSTVLPAVQQPKVPVVILNLSPAAAIDYARFNALGDRTKMTGEWLAHCSPCPVPEIANVFSRVGIPFHQVTGMLENDEQSWREIMEWIEAARVKHIMRFNRLGLMGHYYSGMLDVYTDLTRQYASFGGHIELLEVEELAALRKQITPANADQQIKMFREVFDIRPDCAKADLEEAAITAVALERLVAKYKLGSLAYYYKGTGNPENEQAIASIILGNSWLTAKGVPVAGEYEVKNAQAMKILDSFGAGGSFTEYYAMDFEANVVLMGHDGPGHIAIADGKIIVRPLSVYHGKVGRGLSVEMSVRKGPVTLLSVVEKRGGGLFLLMAEGESVAGPILQIGNTNSRYKFPMGARNFVNQWNSHGPAHHCAVGVGHLGARLEKFAALAGMEIIKVG